MPERFTQARLVAETQAAQEDKRELRREERMREVIRQRHEVSVAVLQVETILFNSAPPGATLEEELEYTLNVAQPQALAKVEEFVGEMPEEMLRYFRWAVSNYCKFKAAAIGKEMQLNKDFPHLKRDKELMGRLLFGWRARAVRRGTVTAERKEGYFLVHCDRREDYIAMYAGQDKTQGGENSVGTYHRSFSVGKLEMPTLLVDASLSDRQEVERTVVHERQHFLNKTVFSNFQDLERKVIRRPAVVKERLPENYLRFVKDEVLARVRESSSAGWATDFLAHAAYGYLRVGFTAEQLVVVEKLLGEIKRELEVLYALVSSSAERAVVLNGLLDVPLDQFPKWIRAMYEFYHDEIAKRVKEMNLPDYREFTEGYDVEDLYQAAFDRARLSLFRATRRNNEAAKQLRPIINDFSPRFRKAAKHGGSQIFELKHQLAERVGPIMATIHPNLKTDVKYLEYISRQDFTQEWVAGEVRSQRFSPLLNAFAEEYQGQQLKGEEREELCRIISRIIGEPFSTYSQDSIQIKSEDKNWVVEVLNGGGWLEKRMAFRGVEK